MKSKSSLTTKETVRVQKYPLLKIKFQSIKKDVSVLDKQLEEFQKTSLANKTELDKIKETLDSLSEMGETESLRLQMAMDRLSKLMSTLSNILKKMQDTQNNIVQNMK